jgi:hypothetical protein
VTLTTKTIDTILKSEYANLMEHLNRPSIFYNYALEDRTVEQKPKRISKRQRALEADIVMLRDAVSRQRDRADAADRRVAIVNRANDLLRSRIGMLRGQLATVADSIVGSLRTDQYSQDLMHATHPGDQNEMMATPREDRNPDFS